jgi:hypothetical protein
MSAVSAAALFARFGSIQIHIKLMSGEILTLKHSQLDSFEQLSRKIHRALPHDIRPDSPSFVSLFYEEGQLPMTSSDVACLVDGATYDLYIMNQEDWHEHLRKKRSALFK